MHNLHQKAQTNPFVNVLLSHNNNNQYSQIQAPVMMRPAQSYFPANQMLMNNLINQNLQMNSLKFGQAPMFSQMPFFNHMGPGFRQMPMVSSANQYLAYLSGR